MYKMELPLLNYTGTFQSVYEVKKCDKVVMLFDCKASFDWKILLSSNNDFDFVITKY